MNDQNKKPIEPADLALPDNSNKQSKIRKTVVVTPTVGSAHLEKAITSVLENKAYCNAWVDHLIVNDGRPEIKSLLEKYKEQYNIEIMELPWNVGANGFYGHRVYAAIGHLVNHSHILFLDEDNYYHYSHIQKHEELFEQNPDLPFTFSKRMIVDQNEKPIAIDQFEAIGEHPHYLVDTSTFCFNRNFLIQMGHLWHHGWGADRRFYQLCLNNGIRGKCTNAPTLNYRLDGNPNSPKAEFFYQGNQMAGFTKEGM